MPPGTPFNAFIPPYRIRVDEFTNLPASSTAPQPLLHLLTHAHSDHTVGLAAKSFGYPVICSAESKEMLLRHEVYKERELLQQGVRAEKVRTYGHLQVGIEGEEVGDVDGVRRDLLRSIPLETPTKMKLSAEEEVVITAFDANHCPGAVMYLIEGSRGAILHTGDVRAEPWFLESLKRNPYLQPYLWPGDAAPQHKEGVSKTLEAIYVDTACVFTTFDVPTKDNATKGLLKLMRFYPADTHFFLNCWTWGYEDILKAVAKAFQSKIHVDRYKYTILSRLSDPFLKSIITRDGSSTRFHACERFGRCAAVDIDDDISPGQASPRLGYNTTSKTGARVVYVNPVTMGSESWTLYIQETMCSLGMGRQLDSLLIPLSRHSPLPELHALVSLFRPKRIVPNTLDPQLVGLDWAAIDKSFRACLHPSSVSIEPAWREFLIGFEKPKWDLSILLALTNAGKINKEEEKDTAVKNLVGADVRKVKALADRWADSGKMKTKLEYVKGWLGIEDVGGVGIEVEDVSSGWSSPIRVGSDDVVEVVLTGRVQEQGKVSEGQSRENNWFGKEKTWSRPPKRPQPESEGEDTDDDCDDERGRTAHLLFASTQDIDSGWWENDGSSQSIEESQVPAAAFAGPSAGAPRTPNDTCHGCLGEQLTPVSSPLGVMGKAKERCMTPRRKDTLVARMKGAFKSPRAPGRSGVPGKESLVTTTLASEAQTPRTPDIRRETLVSRMRGASKTPRLQAPVIVVSKASSTTLKPLLHTLSERPADAIPAPREGPSSIKNRIKGKGRSLASPISLLSSSPSRETGLFTDGVHTGSNGARRRWERAALLPSPSRPREIEAVSPSQESLPSSSPLLEVCNYPPHRSGKVNRKGDSDSDHLHVKLPFVRKRMASELQSLSSPRLMKRSKLDANVKTSVDNDTKMCGDHPTTIIRSVHSESIERDAKVISSSKAQTIITPKDKPRRTLTLSTSISTASLTGIKLSHSNKSQMYLQRIQVGERIAQAMSGRIAPTYHATKAELVSRFVRLQAKEQYAAMSVVVHLSSQQRDQEIEGAQGKQDSEDSQGSFRTIDDGDHAGVDWDRSRRIAEKVRYDLENGRPPTLPSLVCLESQTETQESEV